MVDIHTHIIPDIDDGADSMEETIRLARAAIEEGVSHAVLTPHHNRFWIVNEKDTVLRATEEVKVAIREANIPLTVSPGQEIRMNDEFIEELFSGNYLPIDSRGKYYLVEFAWGEFPAFGRSYLKKMIDADIIPVITHPERQRTFLDEPNLLRELVEMGCISQITTTSIIGGYSEEIRLASHKMMKENLIHVIASDAHDTVERPFNFSSSLKILEADYGKAYKDNLVGNARKIIESQDIELFIHTEQEN